MTYIAVDWLSHELMHNSRDGGVEDERDKKQKPKDTDNGEGSQEQGGVVLDLLQP